MIDQHSIATIIVAAGRGARAGAEEGPKQYRNLGGQSVLARTIEAFTSHPAIDRIIVVRHTDDADLYSISVPSHPKLMESAIGGATRQQSVLAGLQALKPSAPDLVLIHDAARPFVSHSVINNVLEALAEHPAALPAVALVDTIKKTNERGEVTETIPRDKLYSAQTPQGFSFDTITNAHEKAAKQHRADFTDDAALAEWAGLGVMLVSGSSENTKLTTPADFEKAKQSMISQIPDIRLGHGYDTHQLVSGKSIRLCGIDIPFDRTLSGHSDADVGLHALTDALLGSIANGDIGSHFPPSDPKWKDANSNQFLAHAASLVRQAGGTITHCDVTLVCEAPKIGPHRDTMRATMADILDMDIGRISVKATTNERIGFIGREEGIVALATASVVMAGGFQE